MRIVAGEWRGRRLVAPAGRGTRPTSDRVREAVFSILGPLEGERVLDLYAGSGALGLEALSRGAGEATLVERDRAAVKAARANVEALGATARVIAADVGDFLGNAGEAGDQYDLVFLDPPYRESVGQLSLEPVLAPGARVVVESDRRAPHDVNIPRIDERRYGDTLIRIHEQP